MEAGHAMSYAANFAKRFSAIYCKTCIYIYIYASFTSNYIHLPPSAKGSNFFEQKWINMINTS